MKGLEETWANVFVAICFRAVSDFCKEEEDPRPRCGSVTVVQSPGKLNFFRDQTRYISRRDRGKYSSFRLIERTDPPLLCGIRAGSWMQRKEARKRRRKPSFAF